MPCKQNYLGTSWPVDSEYASTQAQHNEVLIALECCHRTTSDHAQAVSSKGEALPVWRQTSSWILALTTIKSSRDHVITPPSGTGWRRLTSSEGGRVIGDLHRMLS